MQHCAKHIACTYTFENESFPSIVVQQTQLVDAVICRMFLVGWSASLSDTLQIPRFLVGTLHTHLHHPWLWACLKCSPRPLTHTHTHTQIAEELDCVILLYWTSLSELLQQENMNTAEYPIIWSGSRNTGSSSTICACKEVYCHVFENVPESLSEMRLNNVIRWRQYSI